MKKLIITLICVAVVASGTFGAYKINESRKSKNAVAKVALVSNMMDSYWGDDLELYGSITEGNVQNVMLDDEKLVEEVLVKEGDTVKKGDPLLKYDITALELDVKQKEFRISNHLSLCLPNLNRQFHLSLSLPKHRHSLLWTSFHRLRIRLRHIRGTEVRIIR